MFLFRVFILAPAFSFLLSFPTLGSDHIDGPITMKHRQADITDLFLFKSSEDPAKLVVVLNTYPGALKREHFSDRIKYSVTIRNVSVERGQPISKIVTSQGVKITCTFKTPHTFGRRHTVACATNNGISAEAVVGDKASTADQTLRLFAGHRSDPFFFNAGWAKSTSETGVIQRPKNDNIMDRVNCLSIVLEFKPADLMGDNVSPMLAVVAQTATRDHGATKDRLLDRVGRPEITNVSMVNHEGDKELRDLYNTEDPFELDQQNHALYEKRLERNIKFFDQLDGTTQWKNEKVKAFTNLLLNDFLVIDWTKPCDRFNFLDIEIALLRNQPHSTCGGRALPDDIMDRLFSLYINGGHGSRISDGVNKPYRSLTAAFPYLAEPEFSILGTKKVWAARALGFL